jgi:hemoglobin
MKKLSLLTTLLLTGTLLAGNARAADYYADFGGQPGMTILVDKFVTRLLADKRIADYFATTNVPKLKQQLAIQFCQELGGPCKYTGLDMAKVHSDLGVTKSAFNALAEDLVWAMNDQQIPLDAQNALMVKLAPMEHQVVTQ